MTEYIDNQVIPKPYVQGGTPVNWDDITKMGIPVDPANILGTGDIRSENIPGGNVTVSQADSMGSFFPLVTDAVSYANTLAPTASRPCGVVIGVGTYSGDITISVGYISLQGQGKMTELTVT